MPNIFEIDPNEVKAAAYMAGWAFAFGNLPEEYKSNYLYTTNQLVLLYTEYRETSLNIASNRDLSGDGKRNALLTLKTSILDRGIEKVSKMNKDIFTSDSVSVYDPLEKATNEDGFELRELRTRLLNMMSEGIQPRAMDGKIIAAINNATATEAVKIIRAIETDPLKLIDNKFASLDLNKIRGAYLQRFRPTAFQAHIDLNRIRVAIRGQFQTLARKLELSRKDELRAEEFAFSIFKHESADAA